VRDAANQVPTASQTVGPFFSIGLCLHNPNNLVPAQVPLDSKVVTLRGRVLDGDGSAVPDAVLEIWRADETGLYSDASSSPSYDDRGVPSGFARIPTNDHGEFAFQTIKPGAVQGAKGEIHAPHLAVLVFMRGLLKHLLTRIYFPDEMANEKDAALAAVPAERRHTLIAVPDGNQNELHWDIRLQGDGETVFFEA